MAVRDTTIGRPLDIERLERLIEDMAEAFEKDDPGAWKDAHTCINAKINRGKRYEIHTKGRVRT